jgi:hypothetical protein
VEGMSEIASMGEAGRIEKGRVVHALTALSVFGYAVWMLLQALAKVRT